MPNACAQQEWPDDTEQRDEERSCTGFAHAVDVSFHAREKHQHESPDLCQKQQRAGGLPALKKMQVQQIDGSGAK